MLQVVQEYERAVIFRLGRLLNGGAKGPGERGEAELAGGAQDARVGDEQIKATVSLDHRGDGLAHPGCGRATPWRPLVHGYRHPFE